MTRSNDDVDDGREGGTRARLPRCVRGPVPCRVSDRAPPRGRVATAEDVAAEALGRAYSQWERISGLDYREAWVMRVASNVAIDTVRKRRGIPMAPPPVDPADAAATRVTLVAALRLLPPRQRDVVVLRYLSD